MAHESEVPRSRYRKDVGDIEKESSAEAQSGRSLQDRSSSIATSAPPVRQTTSTTPEDDDPHEYPEGGLEAWLVVLGSWSGMAASFGLVNSVGTLQAYLSTHQLAAYDPSSVGWIFSIYLAIAFFCGIQIGPIFDAKGPRALIAAGSMLLVGGTFALAESRGE